MELPLKNSKVGEQHDDGIWLIGRAFITPRVGAALKAVNQWPG